MKRKKGFTLIELIAVLVIMAIIALIVTPLVMNIIRKAKISADRRSVDAYGRSVEIALASYLMDTGTFPTDLKSLNIEYKGKEVVCNVMAMKENGGIYLSECTVGGKQVKDDSTEDGWYHYGTRDLTNEEYVDMYGRALEKSLNSYYNEHNTNPDNYSDLELDYKGKNVVCNKVILKNNQSVYLTECSVNNVEIKKDSTDDGYYHFGVDYTDQEYIINYGQAIEKALEDYYNINNSYPDNISSLNINYSGKEIQADILINTDGTVYLANCIVNNKKVDYTYGIDKRPTAVQTLLAKVNDVSIRNYANGNNAEMYTFSHPATSQTPALTDYRYIGATPNNYVYFNGNELWSIVGLFTVEDENGNSEQRLKITRNEYSGDVMKWGSNGNWVTSNINEYLNGEYYDSLNIESKKMIASTKYYLGTTGNFTRISGADYYKYERGTERNSESWPLNWIGKIGLLYPSDSVYIYSLEIDYWCYNNAYNCTGDSGSIPKTDPANGWLFNISNNKTQWLITPGRYNYNEASFLRWEGNITQNFTTYKWSVRPTLYLKSSVKITSGDGSEQSPYQLSL